jgi:hypothetical protein
MLNLHEKEIIKLFVHGKQVERLTVIFQPTYIHTFITTTKLH